MDEAHKNIVDSLISLRASLEIVTVIFRSRGFSRVNCVCSSG